MPADENTMQPLKVARDMLRHRRPKDAVSIIREVQQKDPDNREAQELLGMALFLSRDFEGAKEAFDRLVRLDPRNATAWVNLGATQNALHDYKGATQSLRNAVKRDKRSASAYYNMGIAQKALKMNANAISAYKEAIRLDPEFADAYVNLGNLYIEMNNLNQAIRLLEDAVKKCPQNKKLPVILEKARMKKQGISITESPLGRLVNEEELQKKQIRSTPRELDPAARVREREALRDLDRTMRRSTRPLAELLTGPLAEQLHVMNLAATGRDTRGEALNKFQEMENTLQQMDELREITRKAADEIRELLSQTDPGI